MTNVDYGYDKKRFIISYKLNNKTFTKITYAINETEAINKVINKYEQATNIKAVHRVVLNVL